MDKQKFRLLLKVLLGVMLLGVVISLSGVILTANEYSKSKKEYASLNNYVEVEKPVKNDISEVVKTEVIEEEKELQEESKIKIDFDMDYDSLKDINSDFIGWILYAPIDLSYPVVIDRGDDYYEHYSFENKKNVAGAIFLDYLCKADFSSFNSIIYGHNMRNGTMFGSLNSLLNDQSLIEEDPYFYIFTKDKAYMYEIVSAYYTQSGSSTYDLDLNYSLDDMKEYIEYMESVSVYKNEDFFNSQISEDTRICTLSTCHGLHSTQRTIIHGLLVACEDRK